MKPQTEFISLLLAVYWIVQYTELCTSTRMLQRIIKTKVRGTTFQFTTTVGSTKLQ